MYSFIHLFIYLFVFSFTMNSFICFLFNLYTFFLLINYLACFSSQNPGVALGLTAYTVEDMNCLLNLLADYIELDFETVENTGEKPKRMSCLEKFRGPPIRRIQTATVFLDIRRRFFFGDTS